MTRIFTHAGQAHRDEFIAICLLLHHDDLITEIVRVPHSRLNADNGSKADLIDYVVDVGGSYSLIHRNFDHHQLSPAYGESRSAFAMVAEDLWVWDPVTAKEVFPWYQVSSDMDCHGPVAVANAVGISKANLYSLLSPIEAQLLRVFEKDPNSLIPLMREMGASWVNYYNQFSEDAQFYDEQTEILEVAGLYVLDFTKIPRDRQNNAVAAKMLERYPAAVTVSLDPTGPGLSLYRVDDHPGISFQEMDVLEDITFAHKNGFIAKTKDEQVDWKKILQVAVILRKTANVEVPEETLKLLNATNMELAS